MLKERVRAYCEAGENCSRIILQATAEEYGISLSEDILAVCSGISGGFGVGDMCSGLVAAVMALGLLFSEDEVNLRRILFLMKTQEKFGSLDCCRLSALGEDCSSVLEGIAEILQEIIERDV